MDKSKLAKIQQLGISCVEIDLSRCGRELAGPALAELLLHRPDHKRWVHNAPFAAKLATQYVDYLENASIFSRILALVIIQNRNSDTSLFAKPWRIKK